MRNALIALAALAGLAAPVSALALNPQPLPPGLCPPTALAGGHCEPPDPCIQVHGRQAHARCLARHPRPQNEGWERDRGIKQPGAEGGKPQ
ncbi:MAG: hypothetical protein ACHP7N_00885 [Caulobacterales bacterium]